MPDIETLDLSVKSYATIKRMGINTTEELKDRIEDVLLHTQKAGEEALEKLNALSVVSTEQRKQALELHYKIINSADIAQSALWDMCKNLKEMRDSKLYKALGYKNFESYCESEIGFSRMNAYRYISIAENVNPENVTPGLQIGMKKLYLLSTISEEQQQELSEKVNLEETTVKQLKAEIDKLKSQNKDLGAAKDRAVAELTPLEEKIDTLRERNAFLMTKVDEAEKEAQKSRKSESKAFGRVSILETDNELYKKKIEELEAENKKKGEDIISLESTIEELENRPVEVAVVDNSAENDRKLNEVIRSLERENIKRNEEMDRQYIEDRRQLEADKAAEIEAIRKEYEEKLKTAQEQIGEPDKEKQEFKILLVMTHDAVNRLVTFANTHNKRIYIDKAAELLTASAAALKED